MATLYVRKITEFFFFSERDIIHQGEKNTISKHENIIITKYFNEMILLLALVFCAAGVAASVRG